MILSEEVKQSIRDEFNTWVEGQYAGRSLEERQSLGQFFTPPDLTISMIEKFSDLEGKILDPTCGCGGLIAAVIKAGADPEQCYGIELDPHILEVCRDRLSLLGVPRENIHLGSALNDDCYKFEPGYEYDPAKDEVTFKGKKRFSFGFR